MALSKGLSADPLGEGSEAWRQIRQRSPLRGNGNGSGMGPGSYESRLPKRKGDDAGPQDSTRNADVLAFSPELYPAITAVLRFVQGSHAL